jgi:hypothetical protein
MACNRREPVASGPPHTVPGSHFDVGPGLELTSNPFKGGWIGLIEEFDGSVGEDDPETECGVRSIAFEYLDRPVGSVLAQEYRKKESPWTPPDDVDPLVCVSHDGFANPLFSHDAALVPT